MTFSTETIAFIGLGVMGYPMALNLRSKMPPTSTLLIADVSAPALSSFQAQMSGKGPIKEVSNGFEAVQAADVVVTMLPGSAAVKSVYLDQKTGIIAGAKAAGGRKKKMVMECGTIETSTILEVGKAVRESSKESGLTFVDAPVSGGPMGAEKGTLTFMVGSGPDAEPETFETAKSVLQHMGVKENVFLCGDVGAGTAFKIINNYLSAITSLAASEALNIGVKMGLDPKKLTDVINVSGGQCWVTSASNPVPGVQENVPSSRGYEGGFRIELCKKVLGMGTELAEMVGARTELDGVAMRAFEEAANDERYKGKDARVVYKWLSESERRK